jgi:hypothetical protein
VSYPGLYRLIKIAKDNDLALECISWEHIYREYVHIIIYTYGAVKTPDACASVDIIFKSENPKPVFHLIKEHDIACSQSLLECVCSYELATFDHYKYINDTRIQIPYIDGLNIHLTNLDYTEDISELVGVTKLDYSETWISCALNIYILSIKCPEKIRNHIDEIKKMISDTLLGKYIKHNDRAYIRGLLNQVINKFKND